MNHALHYPRKIGTPGHLSREVDIPIDGNLPLGALIPNGGPWTPALCNVLGQLIVGDKVNLVNEAGLYEVVARIEAIAHPRVRLRVLSVWQPEAIPEKTTKAGGMSVVWRGTDGGRWCIVVDADPAAGAIVSGLASKSAAVERLAEMTAGSK